MGDSDAGRERRRQSFRFILAILVLAAAHKPAAAAAHFVRYGSWGPVSAPACTLAGPDSAIGAEFGRISGSNPFRSFEHFNPGSEPVQESTSFPTKGK